MRTTTLILALTTATILNAQQGLLGEYYNGTNFEDRVTSRTDREINFNWENTTPAPGMGGSYFSVRWTGKLLAPNTGTYTFSAKVDDGIRVWVSGKQIIDAWVLNDEGRFSGSIELKANQYYDLKVEYFNDMLEGEIQLRWSIPGESGPPKAVSSQYFYRTTPASKPAPAKTKPVPPKKTQPAVNKPAATEPEPAPEKQEPAPPPAPPAGDLEKKRRELELRYIYFVQSKDEILSASKSTLDDWVNYLGFKPEAIIYVKGHTDDLGDAKKNQELSEKRAQLVTEYLIDHGIGRERIFSKGYGSSKPYFVNPVTEKERALNRRVEISVK